MARTSNAGTIDFGTALDADELVSDPDNRSVFTRKLTELLDACRSGKASVGKFYKLAEYGNASGARTAAKALTDKGRLPTGASFELRPRITAVDADTRTSELWGAVVTLHETGNGHQADLTDEWFTEPNKDADPSLVDVVKRPAKPKR